MEVDGVAAAGRTERAGVDDGDTVGLVPDAGAVGVAGEDEGSLGVVLPCELGGQARGVPPCGENAENPKRRPHSVCGEVQEVFQPVCFGLVTLGYLGGDAAPDREARGEVGAGG